MGEKKSKDKKKDKEKKDKKEDKEKKDKKEDKEKKDKKEDDGTMKKLKDNDKSLSTLVLELDKDSDVKGLKKALESNTVVHEVHIKSLDDSLYEKNKHDDIVGLFKTIGSLDRLKYLALGDIGSDRPEFCDLPVEALAGCLKKVGKQLLWLYVRGIVLTHDHKKDDDAENIKKSAKKELDRLGDAIATLEGLTKLNLMCHYAEDLASCSMDPILKGLKKKETLEILIFAITKYDGKVAIEPASVKNFFKVKDVKELRLCNVEFKNEHLQAMGEALEKKKDSLEHLYLVAERPLKEGEDGAKDDDAEEGQNFIMKEDGDGPTMGLLFRNQVVQKLQFLGYYMNSSQILSMSIALTANKTLKELEIYCDLDDNGGMASLALGEMLISNKKLESLHMHVRAVEDVNSVLDIARGIRDGGGLKTWVFQCFTKIIKKDKMDDKISKLLGDKWTLTTQKDDQESVLIFQRNK